MSAHSERARQGVHIGSAAFALLLRLLSWPQAAALAIVALLFNTVVLPRVGGRTLYRPVDAARGFPLGILLYPLSVLLLILAFRERLDLVAAAWGVLALGDGSATLAGRSLRSAPLPWNRDKSIAGSVAFVLFGAFGGIALAWWTRGVVTPPPSAMFVVGAPILASAAAALVETLPVRLDDNLSVPVTAGAVLWLASLVQPAAWTASRDVVMARLPLALGFNAVVAAIGYRARTVSMSGMVSGAVIGAVILATGGGSAWTLLFLSFFAATLSSRLRLKRKVRLGIAEERGGRRGAGNAFANCGVAAIAAVLAVATDYRRASLLALTAALTAGGSDTVASEVGKGWGRRTVLVTTWRRAAPGTPGAISVVGTVAGVIAAIALAAAARGIGLIDGRSTLAVVAAATAGAFVESALAATLEAPGILNNDMLNFINTSVAAIVAIALA